MLIFLIIVLLVWSAGHLYISARLKQSFGHSHLLRRSIDIFCFALAGAALVSMSLRRLNPESETSLWINWVGTLAFGLSSLLFFFLASVHGGQFAWRVGQWLKRKGKKKSPSDKASNTSDKQVPPRRQFFQSFLNLGAVGGAATLTTAGVFIARNTPPVVEVDIVHPNLAKELEGYRIVQLSDVHVGPTIKGDWLQKVVQRVNELKPDLVALTGDFIDGSLDQLGGELNALAKLQSKDGLYFVTGNHEYYWGALAWCQHFKKLGIRVLTNEWELVRRGDAKLLVAGVPDISASRRLPSHVSKPVETKEGAPTSDFSLLLAHQPRSVFEAAKAGYDLQLSGHTHGGQYFPMSVLIHLFQPFVAGLHRLEKTQIYVSRGTGYWGPPNRAGSPSEITLLRLRSKANIHSTES